MRLSHDHAEKETFCKLSHQVFVSSKTGCGSEFALPQIGKQDACARDEKLASTEDQTISQSKLVGLYDLAMQISVDVAI